eukprot:200412_1
MEIDASPSKKRSREELSEPTGSSLAAPPAKKQKTGDTDEKSKESTPPLVLDEPTKPKPASPKKPALLPAPSTGMIVKKTRLKKPGLAKVPSNVLKFNGLIVSEDVSEKKKDSDKMELDKDDIKEGDKPKADGPKKKSSDKEEAEDDESSEKKVDIDRQKLIQEVKELLAPCSRELIKNSLLESVIWFDEDDDGNSCIWIAKIMETTFDEAHDVTSMLATFPGYDDLTYWVPIIYGGKWMVYQPNPDILLKDKYANLWHKHNLTQCKSLLSMAKEYLSEMSDSDGAFDLSFTKRKPRKKRKKVYKKRKDRIKTKRKRAPVYASHKPKYAVTTTKYSHGDKRLKSLSDVDTSTISFCPVSKKHLVPPADLSSDTIDHELIEILFSFDTTGSMSTCLDSVRSHLKKILNLLFRDIPKIRIGILAHGDYCDENVYYVMRWVDLTTDKDQLIRFVDQTKGSGGGDAPECYELVMHNASRHMAWSPDCANRSLVLIGDANPHELSGNNPYKLDWREKAKDCKSCGIKIYGIHCLGNFASKNFYETISDMTNGLYITLDKIQSFAGMMVALCHREKDLIAYDEGKESETCQKEKKRHGTLCKKLEEFSVLGLKEMLKHNGQKVSGTKYELIDRIVDCQMYGNMPRCTECGGGHLRVIYINGKKYGHNGNGRYFCPGFYDGDEYVACLWSGDQTKITREKWRDLDNDEDDDGKDGVGNDNNDDNAQNKNK